MVLGPREQFMDELPSWIGHTNKSIHSWNWTGSCDTCCVASYLLLQILRGKKNLKIQNNTSVSEETPKTPRGMQESPGKPKHSRSNVQLQVSCVEFSCCCSYYSYLDYNIDLILFLMREGKNGLATVSIICNWGEKAGVRKYMIKEFRDITLSSR